jgi:hypothetical protein
VIFFLQLAIAVDAFSDGTKFEGSNQTANASNKSKTLVRGTIPPQFFSPTTIDHANSTETRNGFCYEKRTNRDRYQQKQQQQQQQQHNNAVQRKINQYTKDAPNDTVLNVDQFVSTDSRIFTTEKEKNRDRSTKTETLKIAFSVLPESIRSAIYGRKGDDDADFVSETDRQNGRTKSHCCVKIAKATSIALLSCFFLIVVFSIFLGALSFLGFVAIDGRENVHFNGKKTDIDDRHDERWNAMDDRTPKEEKEKDSVPKTPVDRFKSKLKSKDGFQQNIEESKSPPSPPSSSLPLEDDANSERGGNFDFVSQNKNDRKLDTAKKQTIVKSLNVKNYAKKSRDDIERRRKDANNEFATGEIVKVVEYFLNENEDLIVEYDVERYFGYDPDLDDFIGTDYVCCCKTDFLNFCGNQDVFLKEFDYKFSYVILKDPPSPIPPSSSSLSVSDALFGNREKEESRWKLIVYTNDAILRSNKLECYFVGTVFTVATTKIEETTNVKRKESVDNNKKEQKSNRKSSSSSFSSFENLKRTARFNDIELRYRNKEHFYDGEIDKSKNDDDDNNDDEKEEKDQSLFFQETYRDDKKNSTNQKKSAFDFDLILDRLYRRWSFVIRYIFAGKEKIETFHDSAIEPISTKTENKHHIT